MLANDAEAAWRIDDLSLIRDAAAEAGRIAMSYFRRSPESWIKSGTSPVSEADLHVDRFLRDSLLAARPDYGWLSEETVDDSARLLARRTFVVDPIDGTRAFLEGQRTWCVSIAVVEQGVSQCGVLDCPARKEIFSATLRGGAWLDGRRLQVREPSPPPTIGGPKQMLDRIGPPLAAGMQRAPYVPSLAYRVAMIADGRMDATFIKANAHDWDLAAAALILREAGGVVRTAADVEASFAGADVRHGPLAAGHPETARVLVPILRTFQAA